MSQEKGVSAGGDPIVPNPAPFEIPPEMLALAVRSFKQAKFAFNKFMDAAPSTISTFESQTNAAQVGEREVTEKIREFAEQNMAALFDHAQKLVQAKDAQALLTLHDEFVQSQMQVLSEQARAPGEVSSRAAVDTAKPK
jgi:phasin